MTTMVKAQKHSIELRKILLKIIRRYVHGIPRKDIVAKALVIKKIISNEEEFDTMPYNERVKYMNKIRYHLNQMIKDGVITSYGVPSERGPYLKIIYKVVKK